MIIGSTAMPCRTACLLAPPPTPKGGAFRCDRDRLLGNGRPPLQYVPSAIVINADDRVDAAFSAFDQSELTTIPALAELADLDAYQAARQKHKRTLSVLPSPHQEVRKRRVRAS
jgi:hypothetical protein